MEQASGRNCAGGSNQEHLIRLRSNCSQVGTSPSGLFAYGLSFIASEKLLAARALTQQLSLHYDVPADEAEDIPSLFLT